MSSSDAFAFEQLAPAPRLAVLPGDPGDAAQVLRAAAERDAEAIRAAAREQGYAEGVEQGRAELGAAAAALASALEQAAAERARGADVVEREAVELALALAEKVLGAELAVRPELVLELVEGTLRRLVDRDRVVLLVNPDDADLVRDATARLAGSSGAIERLDVQAERRVGRGGAILRTPAGEIDARIGSQLERARETLEAELRA